MWRYRGDGQKERAEQEVAERRRLIVFLDDLDRCTSEAVLECLQALKLYLERQGHECGGPRPTLVEWRSSAVVGSPDLVTTTVLAAWPTCRSMRPFTEKIDETLAPHSVTRIPRCTEKNPTLRRVIGQRRSAGIRQ